MPRTARDGRMGQDPIREVLRARNSTMNRPTSDLNQPRAPADDYVARINSRATDVARKASKESTKPAAVSTTAVVGITLICH